MESIKKSPFNDAPKDDFISQLSDDILASILSRTPTKFAITTSVLSKRWKKVYRYVSNLTLCCEDLSHVVPHIPHFETTISESLQRHLKFYHGTKINFISLSCCVTTTQFDHLVHSLGKLGVEELHLWLSCCNVANDVSFSCHHISKIPSTNFFVLGMCTLQPNYSKGQFSNSALQTLELRGVKILPGSLESVLSACLSLRTLFIGKCEAPFKLCFGGPTSGDLKLENLIVENCCGIEEIEIYAKDLITLEFQDNRMVRFVFGHAPRLQSVYLSIESEDILAYVFGGFTKNLPSLESLTLNSKCSFYEESRRLMRIGGIEKLKNLKRLELNLVCTPNIDLLALHLFLQNCPLLQELHLVSKSPPINGLIFKACLTRSGDGGAKGAGFLHCHPNLKKASFSGFEGTENEMNFSLYILRSAVGLEEMVINRCGKHYMGYGRWKNVSKKPWSEETHQMIQNQLLAHNNVGYGSLQVHIHNAS
ncbi:hypothetical protein DM860_016275 [Cuscuta australis]|uniref:Uncharacterized protein n=1 Tax=Cuscuta australis TaxID=267555 RepID=A0A328E673_9ASTE|nr:hypothetical protein DM860_016275 [Cuscuta australis]